MAVAMRSAGAFTSRCRRDSDAGVRGATDRRSELAWGVTDRRAIDCGGVRRGECASSGPAWARGAVAAAGVVCI